MAMAYGYVRVSHLKSARSGLSEEDQRRRNLACWETELKAKGVSWGGSFEDPAKSASKRKFLERPQARRLFGLLKPGDYLIVALSSRAFRNLRDCLNTEAVLSSMGVTVRCLDISWDTSSPAGKFMRHVLASVDQYQSEMLSDKNGSIAEVLRSQGRVAGGRKDRKPYGYTRHPDNKLTPDHAERRVLEYMLRRHCVDRICDRERIAREIQDMAEKGALKVGRAWNGNKIKAAIAAFWRIVRDEGAEWIQDAGVKDYAVSAGVVA
jgi:DNA invertase Pin-like site-specific DNA recombinase